ncbi:hypothetical protein CXF62_08805 [Psychrobacter sp. MES7-P7E]|nr:hypothetical protein CXF62_08805 [Psychrobacter sp. MES7-P7E]
MILSKKYLIFIQVDTYNTRRLEATMLITLMHKIIQIINTTSKPDDLLGLDVNGMAYRKR